MRSKVKACERLGLKSTHVERPASTSQGDLEAIVDELNADASVHGILVQSPLPSHLDEGAITDRIDAAKDVDGFHPVNLGRLVQGRTDGLLPCTPSGVMEMLRGRTFRFRASERSSWDGAGLSGCRWRFFWPRVALTPP